MENFRFYWMAFRSSLFLMRIMPQVKRKLAPETHGTEEENFRIACRIMEKMRTLSRTETVVFGQENIPEEGGGLFFSNHQGKYDALGILLAMKKPCGVLMEEKQSMKFPAKPTIGLLGGKRLSFEHPKQQLAVLREMAQETAAGRRFLIFPEGGYDQNHNAVQPFKNGCFLCAAEAKCWIVPVAIIDSFRGMNGNSLKKVRTQVHFLPPVQPEEYAGMNRRQICALVETRIRDAMQELTAHPRPESEQSGFLGLKR